MRVTIFGATGLLGRALLHEWKGDEITALGSKNADICDTRQVAAAVVAARPDWIVLAAAYTNVDGCESKRELCMQVNCRGAVKVAEAARQQGARLLFLSSDYVFDGSKTAPYETGDARAPRSVYGESKAQAEEQIMGILPEACIARTSWLFGVGGRSFPEAILKRAATESQIDVVNDQRGSPTYAVDLARAIIELCRAEARGIIHVTNRGDCTWFEFAREILSQAGMATEVRPTTSDKFVRGAERPKYSVLSPRSLQAFGIQMPSWQDAIGRYLQERKLAGAGS